MINVAIAEDHQLVRKSLVSLLKTFEGIEVVFEAEDGVELFTMLGENIPDLILLDIQMPKMDGLQCCAMLRSKYPEIKILLLSYLFDSNLIQKVVESGANGFFSKNSSPWELENAINKISSDDFYLGTEIGTAMRELFLLQYKNPNNELQTCSLSEREKEVLILACRECNSIQIADELNINVRTVETHRRRIMEKTDSKNFIGAVIFAIKHGIISKEEL